jgi:hypothetical protein
VLKICERRKPIESKIAEVKVKGENKAKLQTFEQIKRRVRG